MTANTAHLRADELLRLIDNDATPLERSQFSSHLIACTRCSDEASALRDDSSVFATSLRAAAWENELPPRPSFATIVAARDQRAAAGVVPLRRPWGGVPAWARAAAVLLVVAGPVAAVPAWREWLVQTLTGNAQPRGELRLRPATSGSEGRLTMENAVSEDPIYSTSTLRIRNSSASAATYVLELPQSIRTVTVRIGEADVRTVGAAEMSGGVVISLRR
jgi:hypothetical protein